MAIIAQIQGLTQAENDLLQYIGVLKRAGTNAFTLHQELLPSHGYGLDSILTMLDSLVTKSMLSLPIPYGTASGPADPFMAIYRVNSISSLIAGNFLLAEQVRINA